LPLRSISPSEIAIQPEKSDRADDEQDQAVAARTRRGQPVAGSQALPEMSHFAAEF
jgi:hypothetical protein